MRAIETETALTGDEAAKRSSIVQGINHYFAYKTMFNPSKVAATVCFKLLTLQFYEYLVLRDPALLKVLILHFAFETIINFNW